MFIDYSMPTVCSPKTNKIQVLGDLDGDSMASDADFHEANDFVLQIYGYSDGEVQGNLDQPGSSKSQEILTYLRTMQRVIAPLLLHHHELLS